MFSSNYKAFIILTHNCASRSGWEGAYFNEEGLAVPSWAGGGLILRCDSNSSTARERVKFNCDGASISILLGHILRCEI